MIQIHRTLFGTAAALGLMLSATVPVQASELTPGHYAERASRQVLSAVAQNDLDAAFARAGELGRAGDAEAQARFAAQHGAAADARQTLGELRRVSAPQDHFFAGCVTRHYRAVYEGGQQVWRLKFRRGAGGWYLSDLDVRSS